MGYMYENVKKLCGGNRVASNSRVITDWTPNAIRCLIISRNFIFVAHHGTKPAVLLPLSEVEAANDVKKNGSSGSLTNLLNRRQLSCMEEIYVDYAFRDYKGFLNLESYVAELTRDGSSRLRYYGYGDFTQVGNILVELYRDTLINFNYMFTYANYKHRGKLEYFSTGIDDWYTKYNLRPQYYGLDGPKGTLSIYFRRCEDEVKKKILASRNVTIQEKIRGIFAEIYKIDAKNYESILLIKRLVKYCLSNEFQKSDKIRGLVCVNIVKNIKGIGNTASIVNGLTPEIVGLNLRNISTVERELIHEYKNIGVVKISKSEDNLEEILQSMLEIYKQGTGFLNIPTVFDNICLMIHTDKSVDKLLSGVNCMSVIDKIPNGSFRKAFVKGESGADKNELSGYLSYIFGVVGVSVSDIGR